MPRDSQRSKVYEAETLANIESGYLKTVDEMQKFVNQIMSSRWWKSRSSIDYITVMPGRGCKRALATYTYTHKAAIKMPKWSRYEICILHELTHHLVHWENAAHGREFCRTYLEMIKRFLGHTQYVKQRDAFKKVGVKYCKRKNITPKRRLILAQAAKERFSKE